MDVDYYIRFALPGLAANWAYAVAFRQLLQREILFEHGDSLFAGRVVAVGEDVEEVAVVNVSVPVAHEVPEEPKLLPEEPSFTYVVLESSHGFSLLWCGHHIAIIMPMQNRAETCRLRPV